MAPRAKMTSKSVVRKMVKDIVSSRIEHKVADSTAAFAAVATAGTITPLTSILVQGSEIFNRDGDMVIINELDLVYAVKCQLTSTTNDAPQVVRMIVFADNLNVGAAPAVTDILASASVYAGYQNPNRQKQRFKIYHDVTFDIIGATAAACHSIDKRFKINRKCYFSAASGSTSNGKGALFVLTIVDSAASGNTQFALGWELVYTDA
jgi:hypothetical protein